MFKARILAIAMATAFAGQSGIALAAGKTADQQLKAQINALQQQLDALKASMGQVQSQQSSQQATISDQQATIQKVTAEQAKQEESTALFSRKAGDKLIFQIGKSEVQIYGHADLSADYVSNGLSGAVGAKGSNGWMGDISSNLSYFGIRGNRPLTDDISGVFQFESEISYAATPGTSDRAPDTTAQKFGLGGRNSYLGLQSKSMGAIKLGKTDTPYKVSTMKYDPFASSVGDYNSIMGNTGGDSRTEFDARMAHSIWYESPDLHGLKVSALFSPGQNRSADSDGSGYNYANGEPDCTGGNSGVACNDGAWKNAYSLAANYTRGPLNAIAAYERHSSVDRHGDDLGGASVNGSVGIADEYAYKLGVQYKFATKTDVSFIWESLNRKALTPSQDERTRNGTWLALTQHVTDKDAVSFGWGHAGKTRGQPDGTPPTVGGVAAVPGPADNAANLFDLGYKHWFDKQTTGYVVLSQLNNGTNAHYALGAGGHGVVTRNYDGGTGVGGYDTFTGYRMRAISVGMTYDF